MDTQEYQLYDKYGSWVNGQWEPYDDMGAA